MTIYWKPDDSTDPDSIDVWHVSDGGVVNGPITADVSNLDGMPDTVGGIAPDAVRERAGQFVETADRSGGLWEQVVLDMLTLDYERGAPL